MTLIGMGIVSDVTRSTACPVRSGANVGGEVSDRAFVEHRSRYPAKPSVVGRLGKQHRTGPEGSQQDSIGGTECRVVPGGGVDVVVAAQHPDTEFLVDDDRMFAELRKRWIRIGNILRQGRIEGGPGHCRQCRARLRTT